MSLGVYPLQTSRTATPRGPGRATFPTAPPSVSRIPQYSSKDKKSSAGVVAGLRAKGRDFSYQTTKPHPTGRRQGDFQARQLAPRAIRPAAAAAPRPAASTAGRRSFLGGFFRRFQKG